MGPDLPSGASNGHQNPSGIQASQGEAPQSIQSTQNAPGHLAATGVASQAITERFNVDSHTGGAGFTIPIQTSPGRNGFGPSLSLTYNSASAGRNGVFGLGWGLAGVDSISRKTTVSVPVYDDDQDTFVHSRLGDLVPVPSTDQRLDDGHHVREYSPRVKSEVNRIERFTKNDNIFWKLTSSDNVVTLYGNTRESQVCDVKGDSIRIFEWLISDTYDGHGHQMVFLYKKENQKELEAEGIELASYEGHRRDAPVLTQRYLKSIRYGNKTPNRDLHQWTTILPSRASDPSFWLFEVIFDYGEHSIKYPTTIEDYPWGMRSDPFSAYRAGFEIRTYRQCRRVLMFHHFEPELRRKDCLVSSTSFAYKRNVHSGASFLSSAIHQGHRPEEASESSESSEASEASKGYWSLESPAFRFEYVTPPGLKTLPVEELNPKVSSIPSPHGQWMDLDGEGAVGILSSVPGTSGWYYQQNMSDDKNEKGGQKDQRNQNVKVGNPQPVPSVPSAALNRNDWTFEDLDNTGIADLVVTSEDSSTRGYYARTVHGDWHNFQVFKSYPTAFGQAPFSSQTIRYIDLTGDGRADVLCLTPNENYELTWYQSLGYKGFGEARRTTGGPFVSLRDKALSAVLTCDMSGDGLADIVEIRNGSVSYWPNMGHGAFGSRVAMGNCPAWRSDFSPVRIRMADLTGSGTTDMVYLPPEGGARIYYNQAGNRWSDVDLLDSVPPLDRLSAVDILDIGGRGTQCLCWSSSLYGNVQNSGLSTVHFVDLMGGRYPGLLERFSNGIGGETTMKYRSSSMYYRDDIRAGQPWVTRLPRSVQCVSRVEIGDYITGAKQVKRYAYHNGHYDRINREVRGFQLVETWDADDLPETPSPLQRPPVLTRTWFYVGSEPVDKDKNLPSAYLIPDQQHSALSSAQIPANVTMAERHEAYRALAGHCRRSETYICDRRDDRCTVPSLITQETFSVSLCQKILPGQQHAVCRVEGREHLAAHYARAKRTPTAPPQLNLQDARVQHHVTLETDAYGNVLLDAEVHYGKRGSSLAANQGKQQQEETVISYTKRDYTDPVQSPDGFRGPALYNVQKYRVFPPTLLPQKQRYSWIDLASNSSFLRNAIEITIDTDPGFEPAGRDQRAYRVLLAQERTVYMGLDLNPLADGSIDIFSMIYQHYQLAFTPQLLDTAFAGIQPSINSQKLLRTLFNGGYIEYPPGSGNWWVPSSRPLFEAAEDGTQAVISARQRFYTPNGEVDPYANVTRHELDAYYLLRRKTVNTLDSQWMVDYDYCTLQPICVMDPNQNRTKSLWDPLGRQVAVAAMGKPVQNIGDNLDNYRTRLDNKTLDDFLADPCGPLSRSLLGNATCRTIYDLGRYQRNLGATKHRPCFVAELARHDHCVTDHGGNNSGTVEISVKITYLSGAGNAVQTSTLCKRPQQPNSNSVWRNTGWTMYDNKGAAARVSQAFMTSSHDYQQPIGNLAIPATTVLRDYMDRVAGSLSPDHTWSKVCLSPWKKEVHDFGNTLLYDPIDDEDLGGFFKSLDKASYSPTWYKKRTEEIPNDPSISSEEKQAALQAAAHSKVYAGNATIIDLDHQNRPFRHSIRSSKRESRTHYDVWGHVAKVFDSLERTVEARRCDLLGRPLTVQGMDSGQRWMLPDCLGAPLLSFSSRGVCKRFTYDKLRRTVEVWVRELPSDSEKLVMRKVYGEGLPDSVELNLEGQLYLCYDQAGLRMNESFDFRGYCQIYTTQFAKEYKRLLDWSTDEGEASDFLEEEKYETLERFNALGLQTSCEAPGVAIMEREYDVAGRLKAMYSKTASGAPTSSVTDIKYEFDGRVKSVTYGNGTQTTHTYDPQTRNVIKTCTKRANDIKALQNIAFTYDCLGRLVHEEDKAQQTVFFRNAVVSPSRDFWYNTLGQLVKATGRQQVDQSNQLRPYDSSSGKLNTTLGDGNKIIRYTETYQYDQESNLQSLEHKPDDVTKYTGWKREYAYKSPSCIEDKKMSNRLTQTTVSGVTEEYKYDADAGKHGCMTSIPGYSYLEWNYLDKLHCFSRQRTAGETEPEKTWYVYNADGDRVRKVTHRSSWGAGNATSPTRLKETRYLPLFDLFTTYNGDGTTIARRTITTRVGDDTLQRTPFAMVEQERGKTERLVRYQINSHLELDDKGQLLSFEEYSPFGVSTYRYRRKGAPRKYRFSGYKRDSESGLDHCGARYYAPWLGRWTSPDPLGTVDGLNLYSYVDNDPINWKDVTGTARTSRDSDKDPTWTPPTRIKISGKYHMRTRGKKPIRDFETPSSWSKLVSKDDPEKDDPDDPDKDDPDIAIASTIGVFRDMPDHLVELIERASGKRWRPHWRAPIVTDHRGRLIPAAAQQLLRWDRRGPDEIFKHGFIPKRSSKNVKAKHFDLKRYVLRNKPSVFISTSRRYRNSKDHLADYRPRNTKNTYQYEIFAHDGIDVNLARKNPHEHFNQMEVAFPGGIRPQFIRAAREFDEKGHVTALWVNPGFNISANGPLAPKAEKLPEKYYSPSKSSSVKTWLSA